MRRLLVALFASSGVWLIWYTLPLLDTSNGLMPAFYMWAWSAPAEYIFFNLAPLVFVGIDSTFLYPFTSFQIGVDWFCALLYLTTALVLWRRISIGAGLALIVSCLNALVLASRVIVWFISGQPHSVAFNVAAILSLFGYVWIAVKITQGKLRIEPS